MKTIITLLALVAFAGTAVAAEPQSNAPAAKPAAAGKYPNKGKVLEVIDTSMYTYMQVSSDNGPIWSGHWTTFTATRCARRRWTRSAGSCAAA